MSITLTEAQYCLTGPVSWAGCDYQQDADRDAQACIVAHCSLRMSVLKGEVEGENGNSALRLRGPVIMID